MLPKVVGSRLLSESRSWNDANPGALQQVEGVEDVGGLALGLGRLDGLLGQVQL